MAGAVSLTPIVETFALVALLFVVAATITARRAATAAPGWGAALRAAWLPAAAEALALTLLAALWFGSLGHGGWLLLFLLLGTLAGSADHWVGARVTGHAARKMLWRLIFDVARFVAAGAVCAWRLP